MTFSELFAQAASRSEVVCTFLALLELIRLKQLVCAQPEPFAEIEITRSENAGQAAVTTAAAPLEPVVAGSNPVAPDESLSVGETSAASPDESGGNPG